MRPAARVRVLDHLSSVVAAPKSGIAGDPLDSSSAFRPPPNTFPQQDPSERRRSRRARQSVPQLQRAARRRAADDRIPRIFLPSRRHQRAIERREEPTPDGKRPPNPRRFPSYRLQSARDGVPTRGIVRTLDQVHDAAPDRAHGERPADVIEDSVRARLPSVVHARHIRAGSI